MSFTFFDQYYKVASLLPKIKRDKLISAIVNYVMASETPKLDKDIQPVFLALQFSLDKARVKQGSNQDFVPGSKQGSNENLNQGHSLISISSSISSSCSDPKKGSETCKHSQVETGRFEEFWQAYPRRVKRKVAEKSWQKLAPDDKLVNRILAALVVHRATDQWKCSNGAYIPHPSTWLNQRRWEDELDCKGLEVCGDYDDGSRFKKLPSGWESAIKAVH